MRAAACLIVAAVALSPVLAAPPQSKEKAKAPAGDFVLPLSLSYDGNPGAAAGLGYFFKKTGVLVMGQITYSSADSFDGTTPLKVGCRTYSVPFHAGGGPNYGATFTVAVPLKKK